MRLMDKEYFNALFGYKTAMIQAKAMLNKGLVTADEYGIIETKMCEKFGINSDSLFRENDLLYPCFRGNMSSNKEMI